MREISQPNMSQPIYIAATGENHLLITSCASNTVMVYTLEGQLVHEFGGRGSDPGRFKDLVGGLRRLNVICVDDRGAVYVADLVLVGCLELMLVTVVCRFSDLLRFWTLPSCCILINSGH